jgi:hypothetical protein
MRRAVLLENISKFASHFSTTMGCPTDIAVFNEDYKRTANISVVQWQSSVIEVSPPPPKQQGGAGSSRRAVRDI